MEDIALLNGMPSGAHPQVRNRSSALGVFITGDAVFRRPAVQRAHIAMLAMVALLESATGSQAGPCTTQISQVEQQIALLQANPAPPEGQPTAPQTVDAQLHHQPTPGAVQNANTNADADAAAALERARQADAAGNASGCTEALVEARRLYGID
jgi:hypothetical protein